ncbi:hypothetical protein [Sideroxydans sp. CL21]|nr:hypothetical protein [Sideroxydans sp. CL21]
MSIPLPMQIVLSIYLLWQKHLIYFSDLRYRLILNLNISLGQTI